MEAVLCAIICEQCRMSYLQMTLPKRNSNPPKSTLIQRTPPPVPGTMSQDGWVKSTLSPPIALVAITDER